MSTPVGQSRRAALAGQAEVEGLVDLGGAPAVGDQVAVDHLLQHPRPAPGGVLLVPGGEVRRAHDAARAGGVRDALAHAGAPVHRVDERAAVVDQRAAWSRRLARAVPRAGGRRRRGAGRPARPGLSRSAGSKSALTAAEEVEHLGGVHPRQQLRAGPAVAVLARQAAAVRGGQVGGRPRRSDRNTPVPPASREREVDADVHAAVAEVAVGHPVEAVRRAAGRRSRAGRRRAAPAAPRRPPSRRARAGRRLRAASPAPSSRIRQSAAISAGSVTTGTSSAPASAPRAAAAARASSAVSPVTSAKSQPAPRGRSGTVPPLRRTTSTMRASRPSQATSGWCSSAGDRVGGVGHRRVAEHGERPVRRVLDQPDRGTEHDAERALAADQEPRHGRGRSRAAGARGRSRTPGG